MAVKPAASRTWRISQALRSQVMKFLETADEYPPSLGEVVRRGLADEIRDAEPGRFNNFDDWEVLRAVASAHSASFVPTEEAGPVARISVTPEAAPSVPPKAALAVLACSFAVIGAARGGEVLATSGSRSDVGPYAVAAGIEAVALYGWLLASAFAQPPSNRMVRVLHGLLFGGAVILLALWNR